MYINDRILEIDDSITDLYMCGDIHAAFDFICYKIKQHNIQNAAIILCGDCGFGFEHEEFYTKHLIPKLHKTLKKYNVRLIYIRGNHDDPAYFDGKRINTKYVCAIPDYTIVKVCNKNILCVGGGVSIDREWRKAVDLKTAQKYAFYHKCSIEEAFIKIPGSYWTDEQIKYRGKIDYPIDIICSHSSPPFCFPSTKGDIVLRFAENDPTLLDDIQKEREILDKVYDDYKDTITHWYYGHYHASKIEEINGCIFRLLDIGEFSRHVTDNYGFL